MLPAIREITPPKKMSRNIQFLESNQENANGVLGFILNYALE
jgi:hypothetical protein